MNTYLIGKEIDTLGTMPMHQERKMLNTMPTKPTLQTIQKPVLSAMHNMPVMPVMTTMPKLSMENQSCHDIRKDLDEIKKKLDRDIHAHSLNGASIPQSSDSALLVAKQAGLDPKLLVSKHEMIKTGIVRKREYFNPQETCVVACNTIIDNITYTNMVLLLVLVFLIYLIKN